MKNINEIYNLEFDNFNPIKKINKICDKGLLKIEIVNDLLEILHELNKTFTEEFHVNLIYFLDDKSIYYISKNIFDYTLEEVIIALKIIENCNLIYRFTCAKKFNINDESLKQLRINSWGEKYYRMTIKNRNKKIVSAINKEIKSNHELYSNITKYVSVINILDVSNEIKSINNQLNIKIVS